MVVSVGLASRNVNCGGDLMPMTPRKTATRHSTSLENTPQTVATTSPQAASFLALPGALPFAVAQYQIQLDRRGVAGAQTPGLIPPVKSGPAARLE